MRSGSSSGLSRNLPLRAGAVGTLASPRPGQPHTPAIQTASLSGVGGSGGDEVGGRLRRPRRVLRYKRARDCLLGNFQPYLGVGPISIGKREQKNITAQNERYLHHIC